MFSNKIKGCLYGYAIGDALGLGTEFMTRKEVAMRYPDRLTDYAQIIRDAHRSQWQRGDTTYDTEQVLLMVESIIENSAPDYFSLARKLKNSLDFIPSADIPAIIRWVVSSENFISDPFKVSKSVYSHRGIFEARNESLGRALIAGLWPDDFEKVAIDHIKLTHWDSLGAAAGVVVATMANELLWYRRPADMDRLRGIAARFDRRMLPYLEVAVDGELRDFELDDEDTIWSAPKAAGAALWTLLHVADPAEALYTVILEGGDADTYGSLTLALFGLKYGFSKIPSHLIDGLIGKERIEQDAMKIIEVLLTAADNRDTDER